MLNPEVVFNERMKRKVELDNLLISINLELKRRISKLKDFEDRREGNSKFGSW